MKTRGYYSVVIFLALLISGCAYHKKPQSAEALMMGYYNAPPKITHYSLYTVVSEGSGAFAHQANTQFSTHFDDAGQFHMYTADTMRLANAGAYSYQVDSGNNKRAVLRYVVHQGPLSGKTMQVVLNFHSGTSGVYRAHVIRGGSGSQEGIFEVQK